MEIPVDVKSEKSPSMENTPIDVLNALMDSDPDGYDVIMQFVTDFDWTVESDFKTYLEWIDLKKYKLFDLINGFAECAIESAHHDLIAKLDLSPLNVNYNIARFEKYYINVLDRGLFNREEGQPLFHFIHRIISLVQTKYKAGTINEETARNLVSFWINGPFAVDQTMRTVIINVLCGMVNSIKSDDYNDRWTETIHVNEYPPTWMIEQLLMWFNSDDFETHLVYARFATIEIFNSQRWSKYSPIELTGLILHAKLNKNTSVNSLSVLLIDEYRIMYKSTDCPKFDHTLNYLQIVPLNVNFDRNHLKFGTASWNKILTQIDSYKIVANSKNLRDNIYEKLGGLMTTVGFHATPDTGERYGYGFVNNANDYIERDFEHYIRRDPDHAEFLRNMPDFDEDEILVHLDQLDHGDMYKVD